MKYTHDPDAVLDYTVDLTNWLDTGETITSSSVAIDAGGGSGGLAVDSSSDTDTSVSAWISGGVAGTYGKVRFRFTTSAGRTDDRTLTLDIRER